MVSWNNPLTVKDTIITIYTLVQFLNFLLFRRHSVTVAEL